MIIVKVVYMLLGTFFIYHDVVVSARAKAGKVAVASASWSCDIDDLVGYTVESCEGWSSEDDVYITHGGYCTVATTDPNTHILVSAMQSCQNGKWTRIDKTLGIPHIRKKRLVGLLIYGIGCLAKWWCKDPPKPKVPPTFPSPCRPKYLKQEIYAPPRATQATVKWTIPRASDSDGSIKSTQVHGGENGGSFQGSPLGTEHAILYVAQDNDGMTAYCHFSFIVKVKTCTALDWPISGRRKCPDKNVLGSKCAYSCNEGYELSGPSTVTCENDGWTRVPICKKINCKQPPSLSSGSLMCTDDNNFGSVCFGSCHTGYKLDGTFYRCKANRKWDGSIECTDNTPPVLTCDSPQIFYADRGSTSKEVSWKPPSAVDNSKRVPSIQKTSGPGQGDRLEGDNSYTVTYTAKDDAGNKSPPCSITLQVEVLSCGHPLDTLQDVNLRFKCSIGTYSYGDNCSLSCDDNLPMNGTDHITCEVDVNSDGKPVGRWDWGNEFKPYCREIACPDLDPPTNGALVYDTVASRPIITMLCQNKFDIPDMGRNFNGVFLCQDSGQWEPDLKKAPNCIEPFTSRGFRLPSKIYYYSGSCSDEEIIKRQFKDIVARLNKDFPQLCPPSVSCSVTNPKVICGPVANRKKRALRRKDEIVNRTPFHYHNKREASDDVLVLSFDIQVEFDSSNMTMHETFERADEIQLELLKPVVQTMVETGDLSISSWTVREDSFKTTEYGDRYCDPGSTFRKPDTCNPCPQGQFEANGICFKCPKGQYSNSSGSVACTKCPDGFSTRHIAAESKDNCTRLCDPGSYSPDTFVPCVKCKVGFYQPESGHTQCNSCSSGKITAKTGATTETDCQYFDVLLNGTTGPVVFADTTRYTDFSIMFWMKSYFPLPTNATLFIGDGIQLHISDKFTLVTESREDIVGQWANNAWSQLMVSWEGNTKRLSVYNEGRLVVDPEIYQSGGSEFDLVGNLSITTATNTGLLMSGLRVLDTVVSQEDIVPISSVCLSSLASDNFTMDYFKQTHKKGVTLKTPSLCDAVNDCVDSPCGNHTCTDKANGFTCTCSNSWTGVICNEPPNFCLNNECTNGATCVNGTANYTCNCRPGHSGLLCEVAPVAGGWSLWSDWVDCTKTCNNGTRHRFRDCNSPAPDKYGQECVGKTTESETCNTIPCPECPEVKRGFGTLLDCAADPQNDTKTCKIGCKPGYKLPSEVVSDTIVCGRSTSYKWQPLNIIPDCVRPKRPKRFSVESTVGYKTSIKKSAEPKVIEAILAKTSNTDCAKTSSCKLSIRVVTNVNRRNKRNAGSTVVMDLSVELGEDTSDLNLEQYAINGTISENLKKTIDAVNSLESTAKTINSTAGSVFDVEVDGISYSTDPDSITFDGAASCDAGQVVAEGLCDECQKGTYQNGDHCTFCKKGTYQPQSGQTSCIPCPAEHTTLTMGSKSRSDCYEDCRPGTYLFHRTDKCAYCEKGTYQPKIGQAYCIPCPDGFTTRTVGSKSSSDCIDPNISTQSTLTLTPSTESSTKTDVSKRSTSKTLPTTSTEASTVKRSSTDPSTSRHSSLALLPTTPSVTTTKTSSSTGITTYVSKRSTSITLPTSSTEPSTVKSSSTDQSTPTRSTLTPLPTTSTVPSSKTSSSTSTTTYPSTTTHSSLAPLPVTTSDTSTKTSSSTGTTTFDQRRSTDSTVTSLSTSPSETSTKTSSSTDQSRSTNPTVIPLSTTQSDTSTKTSSSTVVHADSQLWAAVLAILFLIALGV